MLVVVGVLDNWRTWPYEKPNGIFDALHSNRKLTCMLRNSNRCVDHRLCKSQGLRHASLALSSQQRGVPACLPWGTKAGPGGLESQSEHDQAKFQTSLVQGSMTLLFTIAAVKSTPNGMQLCSNLFWYATISPKVVMGYHVVCVYCRVTTQHWIRLSRATP